MKITLDPKYNIAYVQLKEKTGTVNSIKLSEEVVIDLAPDGSLYGIELLNANEQINADNEGNIQFINLLSGNSQILKIAG
jgi:uncharacterized protein YuzE